jgi:peptidoglycan/LPS O-acetylase OafA/YrhL
VNATRERPDSRTFHTLDALRGIAAIGVVMYHIQWAFLPAAAPGGYLAVDLFFMMSGVVLSHAYEERFRAGMGTMAFMRVRLIRLYPLYLLGMLFGVVATVASLFGRNIYHWDIASLLKGVLLSLVFVPDLGANPTHQMFPLNVPAWSLFLEIVVNLLFVVTWPLLSSRRLLVVAAATGAAILAAAIHAGDLDQGSTAATLLVGLMRTLFGFSMGVLIARHVAPSRRVVGNGAVLAMVAVVCAAMAGWPAGPARIAWDAVCVLVVFPLLVCWATFVDPGAQLRKAATFLGLTSYAVYLLHSPLSSVMNSAARHYAGGQAITIFAPWSGIAALAVLLIGCWLVDRHYDTPIRRWLARTVPGARKYTSEKPGRSA